MDLETRLAAAEQRHTEAVNAFAAAEAASQRADRELHGTNIAAIRYRDTYRAMIRAEAEVVSLKAQTRDRDRARLTHDDVKGATHVRTELGWHKVVRVNAKSVTVETGHSWTDRYEFDLILEARALENA